MLGAHLDDLTALAARLDLVAAEVATGRQETVTSTSTLVQEVEAASAAAHGRIEALLGALDTTVGAATAQAESTQWTGANADRFRASAADFARSMAAGRAATTDAFAQFAAAAATMTATLSDFVAGYTAALTEAEAAAAEMARAVEAQRANLDAVMNQGFAAG